MHNPAFGKSFKNIATRLFLVSLSVGGTLAAPGYEKSEITGRLRITYFVAPGYPPLARQAMQSGDVTLTVTVDASGRPTDIAVDTPHPLLGGPTKEAVSKWRFVPVASPFKRKGYVFFHFGFSGTARECDPSTVVAVDLETPRLIVTVDPRPPFGPDALPAPTDPGKRE